MPAATDDVIAQNLRSAQLPGAERAFRESYISAVSSTSLAAWALPRYLVDRSSDAPPVLDGNRVFKDVAKPLDDIVRGHIAVRLHDLARDNPDLTIGKGAELSQ